MENAYEISLRVPQPECDLNSRFTLGGILRMTQQVGMEQCEAQKVGTDYLLSFHSAWILAKVSVEVFADLHEDEPMHIITEPSAPLHAIYKRITSFYKQDGTLAAQVDGRWILADIDSRRLLRSLPVGMSLPYMTQVDKEQCVDMVRAKELTACGSAAALYSRVDLNRHLNNTRYADILCDAMPFNVWDNDGYAKKAVILYRSELPLGHTVDLSRGSCDYHGRPAFYVCGRDGDARCFEANLIF